MTVNTSYPKPIRDRDHLRKVTSFHNLTTGATDLDGLIEYHRRCYVLFELKHKDAPLPMGQILALARMCDDLSKSKPTLLIIATHDTDPETDIDAASALVHRFRYQGKWYSGKNATVKHLTDRFLAKYGGLYT